MTHPARTTFLSRITSFFWEQPQSINENRSSLYDSLCDFQAELEEQKSFQVVKISEVKKLAQKLNGFFDRIAGDQTGQESLCKLYELSDTLLTSDPVNAALWEHMAQPVRQLIQRLHPLFQQPTVKTDLVLRNPKTSRLQPGETKNVMFGDQHCFRVTFNEESRSRLIFSFEEQNNLRLKATAPLDQRIHRIAQEYISYLPYGINNFFHTDKILELFSKFHNRKNIAAQIFPQLTHQLFVVKQSFLNMELEAAGMQTECPLEYASQGEWVIENREIAESLNDRLSGGGRDLEVADQIVDFLTLEKTLGIYILGDSKTRLNPEQTTLFEARGNTIFCSAPRKQIEFLDRPFSKRLNEVCEFLVLAHPQLAPSIPYIKEQIKKAPDPLHTRKTLEKGFASGRLKKDQPINSAIASTCLELPEAFFSNPIAWDTFRTPQDFYLYCKFHLEISKSSLNGESSFDTLFLNCRKLILAIPDKGKPHPLQEGTNFSEVVDWDSLMREKIRVQAMKEIVRRYELLPEKSLQSHTEEMILELIDLLNNDEALKDENPMHCPTIGAFFRGIFWNGFADELNAWKKTETSTTPIKARLALIAATPNKPEMKQKQLEMLLFATLTEFKRNRISSIVREALQV